MRTRIGFIQFRNAVNLAESATPLLVRWINVTGGAVDAGTGALLSGVNQPMSGIMPALVHAEPAKSVLRQYAEIQAGDLIVDLAPRPLVTYADGSSTVVTLDSLAAKGVRFEIDGEIYAQSEVGEDLRLAWDVRFAGQKLGRTVVLRRAT